MRKTFALPTFLLAAVALLAGPLTVSAQAEEESYSFIGLKKCSMCHKKEATGNQLAVWEKTSHAKAYETLAGPEAMKVAKERGIANPQEAPECLECHVTAFPVMADLANQKITMEEGVSCESCHGAGSAYYKKSTMTDIAAGTIEPASVGLVIPSEETCTKCHNEKSPSFKGFDFEEAAAKIAHPIPEGAES